MDNKTDLVIVYLTESGKEHRITVTDPKPNLTYAQVHAVAQTILDSNVFETSTGEDLADVSTIYYKETIFTILTGTDGE